jgi:plastocyanin
MRWCRRIVAALVAGGALGLAVLTFALPAGAGGGGQCSGFVRSTTISMSDLCFQGAAHFVPGGATVTVSNDGGMEHDIQAVDGSFSSDRLQPGDTYRFDAPASGIVEYFCSLHGSAQGGGMTGVLIVGDRAADDDAIGSVAGASTDRVLAAQPPTTDTALVVGSVALIVAVLAAAGVGGIALARFMRADRA